jgi:hypothetical protein
VKAVDRLAPEHEHEFEALPGLPEPLPAGESVLWQGRPQAWAMARRALWLDRIGLYFAALLAWRLVAGQMDGEDATTTALALARMLMPMGLAGGLLAGLGWLMARSTLYTITSRRVVMRIGVVLGITFNLPLARIATARLRPQRDGTGDLALVLGDGDRIAYLHLWPHVRPWRLKDTEPMLRALPDAAAAAEQLTRAWQAVQTQQGGKPVTATVTSPDRPAGSTGPVPVSANHPAGHGLLTT